MKYKALHSWRGLCAIIVTLFHFPIVGVVKDNLLIANGYLFVDFFFVLSGFVISTTYKDRIASGSDALVFLFRRFGRLWPLHIFMLTVFVGAAIVKGDIGEEPDSYFAITTNILLLQGLGFHEALTWNDPSWSISVEFLLYIVFAAFCVHVKHHLKITVAAVTVALSLLVLMFFAPHGIASTYDYGIFRGLAGFFVGYLITLIPPYKTGTLMEVTITSLVIGFVYIDTSQIMAPVIFGAAVYIFAYSDGLLSRGLEARVPTLLGDWSYSIYMVHAAVISLLYKASGILGLEQVGGKLVGSNLWVIPYLAVIIGISTLTYRFIEEPYRKKFQYATQPIQVTK